jgi:hypothetical protein
MHIYAFGSICRGDISFDSDVDLLVIVEADDPRFDRNIYSIYSYEKIRALWQEGNPFAWHLALESRLLFSSDSQDYLKGLGRPEQYKRCLQDCEKFFALFQDAYASISVSRASGIFDLATVFLSIRNIATCFSLGVIKRPDFSRNSARQLGAENVPLVEQEYCILERARILCTRGIGIAISDEEISIAIRNLDDVYKWMSNLVEKAKANE